MDVHIVVSTRVTNGTRDKKALVLSATHDNSPVLCFYTSACRAEAGGDISIYLSIP